MRRAQNCQPAASKSIAWLCCSIATTIKPLFKKRMKLPTPEIWFVTGSQHLYGPGPLKQVAANSQEVVDGLNGSKRMALPLIFKSLVTRPEEIRQVCQQAGSETNCAGLILWMHTFSPSKMWIGGLKSSAQAVSASAHAVQSRSALGEIDMDFMNLNQAAHGDREAGFIHTRLRLNRKVVVGHWSDPEVQDRIGAWMRVARAWHDWQGAEFARFADNMRYVAVTEGDKVSAEACFGYSVNHHAVGDLVQHVNAASDAAVTKLCAEYERALCRRAPLREAVSATSLCVMVPHRAGPALDSRGGELQGLHDQLSRPSWSQAAARPGRSAPHGRWLWLCRRRRLEDRRLWSAP